MSGVGPLVVLGGLTSAVHGPCTPLGIRKHTVYLAGSDLGGTNMCTLGQTHGHETKHCYKVVALDLSSLCWWMFTVAAARYQGSI